MAPGPSKERGMQPAVKKGMGELFSTPPKKRNDKRKTQTAAFGAFDHETKKRKLLAELDSMAEGGLPPSNPYFSTGQPGFKPQEQIESGSMDLLGENQPVDRGEFASPELKDTTESTPTVESKKKRITPNQAEHKQHTNWAQLIPTLVDDFLEYSKHAIGKAENVAPSDLRSSCLNPPMCQHKSRKITCLYFDRE